MGKETKVIRITLPFTLREWRKGQRFVLVKLASPDVQVVYHGIKNKSNILRTETHKVMSLKKRLPFFVRSVIPTAACTVDEYSTNIDAYILDREMNQKDECNSTDEQIVAEFGSRQDAETYLASHQFGSQPDVSINSCITTYRNRYFSADRFSLVVKTHAVESPIGDPFGLGDTFSEEWVDFRKTKKAKERIGSRDYSGSWQDRYPHIECYKLVDASVNHMVLGWVANEVAKSLKGMLVDFQYQIIETYDEWKDLTEEELRALEREAITKSVQNK